MTGERVLRVAGWVFLGLGAAVGIGLVLGLVVRALWNWLMPELFGLPEITYLQAVALFVLSHLLFKSHGGHPDESHHKDHGHYIRDRVHRAIRGDSEETGSEPAADSV